MELTKDTPVTDADDTHPQDPHQTGSGDSASPGGKDAPAHSALGMAHSGGEYPGPNAAAEPSKTEEEGANGTG